MTTASLFAVEVHQSTLVIVPRENVSSLDDDRVQPELTRLINTLEEPAMRNVVVDFGKIDYFGSSMLEAMLKVWKQVQAHSGKMAVCSVSAIGLEVLQVGRFTTLWEVCESRSAALKYVEAE